MHSIKECLAIAETVYLLNGDCHLRECASKLKKQVTGPFLSLVASSVKFGLITHSKQQLRSTETLNHWMASKSEAEKYQLLKKILSTQAFLKEFVTESSEDDLKNLIENKDLDKELVRDQNLPLKTAKTLSKVIKESFGYLLSLSEASEHSTARPKHTHPTPSA